MKPQYGWAKRSSKEQFDRQAEFYDDQWARWSDESLRVMFSMYEPNRNDVVLDVATGTGYTAMALAPMVNHVVAADISTGMLAQAQGNASARELTNITYCEAAAELMPFKDESFTLITCRIAAHHFVSTEAFLKEAYRLLGAGGRLLLADTVVPDDPAVDQWQNTIEEVRDPSHVRNLHERQWRSLIEAAGFNIVDVNVKRGAIQIEVADWMRKAGCDEDQERTVLRMLKEAPDAAKRHFEITETGGDWKVSWYRIVALAVKH